MGLRFRKSINIGKHFRINISKKGIGYSYGVKGYRHTVSANSKEKDTFTIPGTGISHVSSSSKTDFSEHKQAADKPYLFNKIICYILGIFLMLLAVLFAVSGNTVSVIFLIFLAFVFCVAGKKAQWDYEDYTESVKQKSTSTPSHTAPTSKTSCVETEKTNTTIINLSNEENKKESE